MRFKVNGHLSKREAQTNGVRQGCPCSPLLYIIALQPLLAMLEQDDRILGIDVPGGRVKHFSYAAQTNTLHYFSSLLLPRAVRRLHPDAVRRRLPRHASPPPPQPARVCVVSTPVAWASRIRFAGARPREVVGCALLLVFRTRASLPRPPPLTPPPPCLPLPSLTRCVPRHFVFPKQFL